MKSFILLLISLSIIFSAKAQIAIGGGSPNASAVFQLNSTTKGFVPPRMTTGQRLAIVSPIDGLMVFDTSTDSFWFFNTNKWNQLANQASSVYKQPTDRTDQNGAAGDRTGTAISLGGTNGTLGIVGAPGDNSGRGTMYRLRFMRNNLWSFDANTPNTVLAGDGFGNAVAVDKINTSEAFIVGSSLDDSTNVNSGSAYIFDDYSFKQKIVAGDAAGKAANAHFGRSVDINGKNIDDNTGKGYVVVGASGANSGRGEIYIYKYNPNTLQWNLDANLVDPNGLAGDSLGLSVSLYYDVNVDEVWAFAGAPYDDEISKTNVGSVLVYRKALGSSTWVNVAKIVPTDGLDNELFGYSVGNCFECQKVIAGSPGRTTGIGRVSDLTLSSIVGNVANFTVTTIPNSGNGGGNGSLGMGFTQSIMKGSDCNNIYLTLGSGLSGIVPGGSTGNSFGYARLLKFNGTNWNTEISEITDPNPKQGYGYGRAVSINTKSNTIFIGAPLQKVDGNANQGKIQIVKFEQ
ncbi:FG-GAP repeat protein [Arcicella aurantiaca]|uniref:FG-GAP repeat protein n=1 Tax=Arcicella aurantiaca TaxID=591202 RepID=A0A316EBR7_9BACT|nr:FG-GAP repeat protein [Arcicella aurantiaca]PWK27908.1 FG-GAP repeat protein [Arcicella aurantiaca]